MEMPPLFYIAALAIMLTQHTHTILLMLAWSYFTFRVGHGLVHLTLKLEKSKWRESSQDADLT